MLSLQDLQLLKKLCLSFLFHYPSGGQFPPGNSNSFYFTLNLVLGSRFCDSLKFLFTEDFRHPTKKHLIGTTNEYIFENALGKMEN